MKAEQFFLNDDARCEGFAVIMLRAAKARDALSKLAVDEYERSTHDVAATRAFVEASVTADHQFQESITTFVSTAVTEAMPDDYMERVARLMSAIVEARVNGIGLAARTGLDDVFDVLIVEGDETKPLDDYPAIEEGLLGVAPLVEFAELMDLNLPKEVLRAATFVADKHGGVGNTEIPGVGSFEELPIREDDAA